MRPCLESTGDDMSMVDVNWTSRLIKPSKRLEIIPAAGLQRAKEQVLASDFNYWVYLTDIYVRTFGSSRVADIRNVLDINAGYGRYNRYVTINFALTVDLESSLGTISGSRRVIV